jgi:hypothetical protein
VIEAEIARAGTEEVLKKILTDRKPGPPCLPKENPFGIYPEEPVTMPSWLPEADLSFYATKYSQKGFTGGLNYYRALDLYVLFISLLEHEPNISLNILP